MDWRGLCADQLCTKLDCWTPRMPPAASAAEVPSSTTPKFDTKEFRTVLIHLRKAANHALLFRGSG